MSDWWTQYGQGRANRRSRTAEVTDQTQSNFEFLTEGTRETKALVGHESLHKILSQFSFADAPSWDEVKDNYHLDQIARHPDRESIRQNGIREPIAIDYEQSPPQVVDGHTRLIHAEALGLKHVPVKNTTFADHHYYSSRRIASGSWWFEHRGEPEDPEGLRETRHTLIGAESVDSPEEHTLHYTTTPHKTIKVNPQGLPEHAIGPMRQEVLRWHPDHVEHDPAIHDSLKIRRKPRIYYHGTGVANVTHILPANRSGRKVNFPESDPDYAYATRSQEDAWMHAENAAEEHGRPRVYQVRPMHGDHSHVEKDPEYDAEGRYREGIMPGDHRSAIGWEVVRELKVPREMRER